MDKITKAHYRYVRQNLESMNEETRECVKNILKLRADCIKNSKLKGNTAEIKNHYSSVVIGLQWALSELGIDIKRYGG